MTKTLQQQVIEIIAIQAVVKVSVGNYANWDDISELLGEGPDVDEHWFWDAFKDMVKVAEGSLISAVEAWVAIEYEGLIDEKIEAVRQMFAAEGS